MNSLSQSSRSQTRDDQVSTRPAASFLRMESPFRVSAGFGNSASGSIAARPALRRPLPNDVLVRMLC